MTMLDVYLLGMAISSIFACCKLIIEYRKNEQIVLSDIVGAVFWIVFSWFTILMCIIYVLQWGFNWLISNGDNIIIWKRKK